MNYLFFVQGEGRGHLSQALTLKSKLEKRGHRVTGIIVGAQKGKEIPAFFKERLDIPLYTVYSPGFVLDKDGQGIRIVPSVVKFFESIPSYLRSLREIRKIVSECKPDILINFYEPLAGNYYRLFREKRPLFSIAHQYFLEHPEFKFPPSKRLTRFFLLFFNRLTAPSRGVKIALSFTPEKDQPEKNLFICPPLIRPEIKNCQPKDGDFLLIYLLNSGYSQQIIDWSQANPTYKIEAFWDRAGEETTYFSPSLTFHYLSGEKFIDRLQNCRAYVSTAGFDSISEAAYLQKEILMVPTKNHFEQKCNAADARRIGLALTADSFDLSLVAAPKKNHSSEVLGAFKEWDDDYDERITDLLEK